MTNEELVEMIKILQEEIKTLSDTINIHAIVLNDLVDLLGDKNESAIRNS